MISAVIMVLMAILSIISATHLFFKYISPKEKKELKLQRDKLFRDVERLLKKGDKESVLQVIKTFDELEEISDKLGDFGSVNELRQQSNNLRRQLGLETKGELGASPEDINKFIQQLMRGPYGRGTILNLALPEGQAPQMDQKPEPKSLLQEGAEILARLRNIRGEEVEEKPTMLFPPAQSGVIEPSETGLASQGQEPTVINLPPPSMPPRGSPPPSAVPPPMAPPMAPPTAPPRAPFNVSPISPIAAPAKPAGTPFTASPRATVVPASSPVILPPPAPSSNAAAKAPLPFTSSPATPPRPIAIPIQPRAASSSSDAGAIPLPEIPLPRETDEPQLIQVSEPASVSSDSRMGAPSPKSEKNELLARLNQELPYLPENERASILEELMKRPAGKLRETWFKIIVHKNKQYAAK